MAVYKHILVAIDFSEHSLKALKKAEALASSTQATIDLVHVVDIPTYPVLEDIAVTGMPGLWGVEQAETLMELSTDKLMQLASGLTVRHRVVVAGVAAVEISALAKVNNIDVVVMGFHGLSGFKRLLGSTTHSVLNEASCDVLAIK